MTPGRSNACGEKRENWGLHRPGLLPTIRTRRASSERTYLYFPSEMIRQGIQGGCAPAKRGLRCSRYYSRNRKEGKSRASTTRLRWHRKEGNANAAQFPSLHSNHGLARLWSTETHLPNQDAPPRLRNTQCSIRTGASSAMTPNGRCNCRSSLLPMLLRLRAGDTDRMPCPVEEPPARIFDLSYFCPTARIANSSNWPRQKRQPWPSPRHSNSSSSSKPLRAAQTPISCLDPTPNLRRMA